MPRFLLLYYPPRNRPSTNFWGARAEDFAVAEGAGEKLALFSFGKGRLSSENCIRECKSRKIFASDGVVFCTAFLILYPRSKSYIYQGYF